MYLNASLFGNLDVLHNEGLEQDLKNKSFDPGERVRENSQG